MQVLGHLGEFVHLMWHKIAHNSTSQRITTYVFVGVSLLILYNAQFLNAYAHVSHVLPAQQYTHIKSNYPDIEITATLVMGLIVVLVILVQSFQKHRRTLKTC